MALTESFDSYTDGNLNGQGGWSGDTNFKVEGSVVQAGTKAASANGVGVDKFIFCPSFTPSSDGIQTFYHRISGGSTAGYAPVDFYGSGGYLWEIYNYGGNFYLDGQDEYVVGAFSYDVWHKIDLQWQSNGTARARMDDGTWTNYTSSSATFTPVQSIRLGTKHQFSSGTAYWDSFNIPPIANSNMFMLF